MKELQTPQKYNEKPLLYVATYSKNNPELFTEVTKNLELKINDKIKEILGITKIIKIQRQPKNLKKYSLLLHLGNTQHMEL